MSGSIPCRDAFSTRKRSTQGIEQWTHTFEKYALMEKCQAAGVRAMAVQSPEDRVEHDPQLRARGFYTELEHPLLGQYKIQGIPFKLSQTPAEISRPAPLIGQHTREVLTELLGLSLQHIGGVLEHFFAHVPQEDAWRAGQENGLPWGGVRSLDEIIHDEHLRDRGFFTEVEHPELERRFIYPGGATIYNGSPWRISRRAPLIGEHNEEIFCGELGVQKAALTLLAESGII